VAALRPEYPGGTANTTLPQLSTCPTLDSRTLSVVTGAETRARINGIRDVGSASDRGEGGEETLRDNRRGLKGESSGKTEARRRPGERETEEGKRAMRKTEEKEEQDREGWMEQPRGTGQSEMMRE